MDTAKYTLVSWLRCGGSKTSGRWSDISSCVHRGVLEEVVEVALGEVQMVRAKCLRCLPVVGIEGGLPCYVGRRLLEGLRLRGSHRLRRPSWAASDRTDERWLLHLLRTM